MVGVTVVVVVVVVVSSTTLSSINSANWSMYEVPSESVLLAPLLASHNMNPPKFSLFIISSVTYSSTLSMSAYPLPAELSAPGNPTYNLMSLFGARFSAKSCQVSQLKLRPKLQ